MSVVDFNIPMKKTRKDSPEMAEIRRVVFMTRLLRILNILVWFCSKIALLQVIHKSCSSCVRRQEESIFF